MSDDKKPRLWPWIIVAVIAASLTACGEVADATTTTTTVAETTTTTVVDILAVTLSHLEPREGEWVGGIRGSAISIEGGESHASIHIRVRPLAGDVEAIMDELEALLIELGFSPATRDRIGMTRALDGTQTATSGDAAIEATWTYHPDRGLRIVLER